MFNFGAQQQPQAGAAGGGLFGAAATPTTQVAGGGLFGAPATQAPAAQGLFGAATPTPAGGGLFGQKPAATTAPAAGLFGAPAGNAAPATTAATPAAAGGLTFGAPAAAGAAGGLFGAKPTTQPLGAQPTAWQAQPKAATTGAPAAAANPAAAATQPAQQITAKTKYADLPDNVRQKIDEIEKFIQQQIHISDSIGNSTMDEPIAAVSEEVQVIMQRLVGVRNLLQRDQHVMDELKKQVNQELRNTDLASRYIDRAQNAGQSKFPAPQQDAYASYFNTFANDLERRMQMYRQNIEEIELNVRNMMVSPGRYTPQVIQEIIRNQYEAFIRVASKSAHMHDEIERERAKFEKFCQKYMGEARPGRLFSEGSLTGGAGGAGAPGAAGAGVGGGIGDEPMSLSAIASKLQPTLNHPRAAPQPAAAGGLGGTLGGGLGAGFGAGLGGGGGGGGGGLFGGAAAAPAAAGFGAAAAGGGGGLFGNVTAASAAAAAPAPAAGGLFGATPAAPAAAAPAAGGLFATPAARPAAGGLFGGGLR